MLLIGYVMSAIERQSPNRMHSQLIRTLYHGSGSQAYTGPVQQNRRSSLDNGETISAAAIDNQDAGRWAEMIHRSL